MISDRLGRAVMTEEVELAWKEDRTQYCHILGDPEVVYSFSIKTFRRQAADVPFNIAASKVRPFRQLSGLIDLLFRQRRIRNLLSATVYFGYDIVEIC